MFPISRLFIIATLCTWHSFGFSDYDVLKFEINTLPGAPVTISVNSKRDKNRGYKFNATLVQTADDLHIYDVEASVARSVIGNNQFVLSPFKIPTKPVCDFLTNEYRTLVMDDVVKYSNLPNDHDKKVDYCGLLKKMLKTLKLVFETLQNYQYEIINYWASVENLPKYTPIGTYKFNAKIINRNTNEIVVTLSTMTKLY